MRDFLLTDRRNVSVVDGSSACLREPESVVDNSSRGLQRCLVAEQIIRHSCTSEPAL